MSILALHEGQAAAAAPGHIPPAKPEPQFSAWGVATAIPRGIGEAAAQVMGTAADIGNAFAYMRDATPEQRKAMDAGGVPVEQFSGDLGDSLRDRGREFRPDPQTASTAEQLLYGFARGASKIVAGAVAAGPAGVVAAGIEEGVSQADELRRQGVGVDARGAAGAVQGAGLALAALPLVGQSLKATAALYVAGGPGGFMAQQALTREILRNAGQDQVAAQFDPFDPVGLAVASLIPAGFAAWGIRGQRAAAAAKAAEDFRTGPVPSEVAPVAAAVRQAYSPEVVDAALVAYSVERAQHADDAAQMAAYAGRRVESLADFMAATKIKDEPLPPEVAGNFLAFIRDAGGMSFAEKYDVTGERSGVLSNPAGIFRKGGRARDELAILAEESGYLKPGQGQDSGAFVDLVQAAIRGERVLSMDEQMMHAQRSYMMQALDSRRETVEGRLRLLGIDPAPAGGNVAALEAYAARHEPQILAAALDEVAAARAGGEVSPEYAALQDRARGIAQDMQDGGRTLEQYEAEVSPLSPVMRRLVGEAMEGQPRAAEPTQAANPERTAPGSDAATAPGVPGSRPAAAEAAGLTIDEKGTFLAAKVDGGYVGGHIKDGGLYISAVDLDAALQGKGMGLAMYQAVIDVAHARGLRVFSDKVVSMQAARVYEALQRRGYDVKKSAGGGEIAASEDVPGGALYGKDSAEPVFEVMPKKAQAAAPGSTPGASAETAAAAVRIDSIRAQHPDLMVQIDGMDAPMRMDDFLAAVKAEADEMAADAPLMEVAAQCALLNGP